MPKHFSTKKRYLTNEEKRQRAIEFNEYCEGFETVNVEAFVKKDIFDETLVLKCLNCGFEEEIDYDIVSECWDSFMSDYPVSYCPKCNTGDVVPLDVYNHLKK
jgi:hypothetical protein